MIPFNSARTTAVIYPTGVCNLNCRYCGINKNPALKEIDEVLGESFKGDYYFNRIKEYFPRKDMLRNVETWGGEPFIHMDRIYPLVRQLIDYYPYFDSMYSSTNFSYNSWLDQFFGLMDVFGEYPYRDFKYCLQLSVDGPTEINDAGRGNGVTERCIANFDKLVAALAEGRLPSNVRLTITEKGTLDCGTIKNLLSKDKIIEYYQFYEDNFIDKIAKLKLPNVGITHGIPNTAVPSPVTVQEGKEFAEFCRMCREIEAENAEKHYFKYYQEITPFGSDVTQDWLTYKYGYHTCGTGDSVVGFLPDNMMSTCHEGFTQMVEDYEKYNALDKNEQKSITFDKFVGEQKVSLCTNDEGYATFEYKMSTYCQEETTARLATSAAMNTALAMAGQVDEAFLDETNALKGAIFIQAHTSYCIKDNYNKTGSYTMTPVGIYKLLLNGAMRYIQHEGELKVECC